MLNVIGLLSGVEVAQVQRYLCLSCFVIKGTVARHNEFGQKENNGDDDKKFDEGKGILSGLLCHLRLLAMTAVWPAVGWDRLGSIDSNFARTLDGIASFFSQSRRLVLCFKSVGQSAMSLITD